jgi:hypothetical protein
MLVELPITANSRVKKQRSRTSVEVLRTVPRSFMIREPSSEEAPLVMTAPSPTDIFGQRLQWRSFEGALWVESGTASDASKVLAATLVSDLRATMPGVHDMTAIRNRERVAHEQIREHEWTDEDEVVALVARRTNDDHIVLDGRLFTRTEPPVLMEEFTEPLMGSQSSPALPECLWMVDEALLKSVFPGRADKTLAKAVPHVLRQDLLDFDRLEALARAAAHRALEGLGAVDGRTRNPFGHGEILRRMLRRKASPAELVEQASLTSAWRSSNNYGTKPKHTLLALTKMMKGPSDVVIPLADPFGSKDTFRLPVAINDAHGEKYVVETAVPVVAASTVPLAASVKLGNDGPTNIRHDGKDFIVPITMRVVPTAGELTSRDLDFDAIVALTTANRNSAVSWKVGRVVSAAMEWHDVVDVATSPIEERARVISQFVADRFLVVDGELHVRSDEPLIEVNGMRASFSMLPEWKSRKLLARNAAGAMESRKTVLLMGVSDAGLIDDLIRVSSFVSEGSETKAEIRMPEVFAWSTADRTVAYLTGQLLSNIATEHMPRDLVDVVDDVAEACLVASSDLSGHADAGAEFALGQALVRLVAIVETSDLLKPIENLPIFTAIRDRCIPHLLDGRKPQASMDEGDDATYAGLVL